MDNQQAHSSGNNTSWQLSGGATLHPGKGTQPCLCHITCPGCPSKWGSFPCFTKPRETALPEENTSQQPHFSLCFAISQMHQVQISSNTQSLTGKSYPGNSMECWDGGKHKCKLQNVKKSSFPVSMAHYPYRMKEHLEFTQVFSIQSVDASKIRWPLAWNREFEM